MNTNQSRLKISRRNFLKIIGVAGVTAVGGYVLSEYTPWLNYDGQMENTWMAPGQNSSPSTQMRTLVHYATLAANGHNTQPWKFAIKENAIEIHPDYSRHLQAVDPNNREMWISLGCALENLMVSARGVGYSPEVTYPDATDFINIKLTSGAPKITPLFDAISKRQNTRSEYDGKPIPGTDLDQIKSLPLEPGVNLRFVTAPAEMETVLEYVNQGNLIQYADQTYLDELIAWLRFNKKEALSTLDGLYSRCSGNPEVPRWLGQMFVSGTKPQQQVDLDAKKLRSSPAAVVIASQADTKTAWVRTGQVYERLALKMTSLNIKSAFLNQPIEVSNVRSQFQSAMELDTYLPQLLVRFGYADTMLRSVRRPVDQVLI